MTARTSIVRLQRLLLRKFRRESRSFLEDSAPEIRRYHRVYNKELRKDFSVSSLSGVIEEILEANIVLCGDYHTLRHAQKANIRILRHLVQARPDKKIVLFLEMIHQRHQHLLDEYMAGHLSEQEFLTAIDYETSWGFNWENYRPLLDFAGSHGIDCVALNVAAVAREGNLRFRDRCAAELIAQHTARRPDDLLWVVIGDLHLAPPHLPAQIKSCLDAQGGAERKLLVLYQNSDHIYWKLAESGIEDRVDVVRLSDGSYCLTNVTPWVKLQSFLSWIENSEDRVRWGRFRDPLDNDRSLLGYHEQIQELLEALRDFLGIRIDCTDCFTVCTPDDLGLVDELVSLDARYRKLLPYVLASKSFFLPGPNLLYLSRPDINHAAECASELLHFLCTQYRTRWQLDSRDAFFRRVYRDALGFLGSKLINPKRKCDDPALLLTLRRHGGRGPLGDLFRSKYVTGKYLLIHEQRVAHLLRHGGRVDPFRDFYRDDLRLRFGISRGLGHYLGEQLYRALMEGRITREFVREIYLNPLERAGEPFRAHLDLLRLLRQEHQAASWRDPAAGGVIV